MNMMTMATEEEEEEEEAEPNPNPFPTYTDHDLLDWLPDPIPFSLTLIDHPYPTDADADGLHGFQWWDQDPINASSVNSSTPTPPLPNPSPPQPPDSSRGRKQPDRPRNRNQADTLGGNDHGNGEEQETTPVRKPARKPSSGSGSGKTNSSHSNSGGHKDARWAEQLLNPCASAITAGNPSRIQHLLYVLHELASLSGDANHRLAAHGLRALTNHLSGSVALVSPPTPTFSSTESRVFQNSLIKFHELSPWFSTPNSLANASILQTLTPAEPTTTNRHRLRRSSNLQIVDIGVSHGIQWPTLLESLSQRPGGPPPLVRLTVVAAAGIPTAFSSDPPGDDFLSRLLRFAKRINVNLQIDRIENQPLQSLTAQALGIAPRDEETLIICAQFRLHQLPHEDPDDRTEFLQRLRDLEPDLVVLTENEGECSCSSCGDFASGFPRRVEFLWKFLDSTSAAFKGRECEERRVMEGEAATALWSAAEMNEGKVRWCERMTGLGFVSEGFGEEAIEGGRALLRKYDSNWEMRTEEKRGGGCVCLCWKGQPVSFCSLWKLPSH